MPPERKGTPHLHHVWMRPRACVLSHPCTPAHTHAARVRPNTPFPLASAAIEWLCLAWLWVATVTKRRLEWLQQWERHKHTHTHRKYKEGGEFCLWSWSQGQIRNCQKTRVCVTWTPQNDEHFRSCDYIFLSRWMNRIGLGWNTDRGQNKHCILQLMLAFMLTWLQLRCLRYYPNRYLRTGSGCNIR